MYKIVKELKQFKKGNYDSLFLSILLCVDMWYTHMRAHAHMHMEVKGQNLGVFLNHSSSYFFEAGSLIECGSNRLASPLANKLWGTSVLVSLAHATVQAFYVHAEY